MTIRHALISINNSVAPNISEPPMITFGLEHWYVLFTSYSLLFALISHEWFCLLTCNFCGSVHACLTGDFWKLITGYRMCQNGWVWNDIHFTCLSAREIKLFTMNLIGYCHLIRYWSWYWSCNEPDDGNCRSSCDVWLRWTAGLWAGRHFTGAQIVYEEWLFQSIETDSLSSPTELALSLRHVQMV